MAVDHLKPFEASKAVRRIVSSLQMIARRMDIPMEKMKNISGKVDFDLSLIGTGHRKIIAQIFDALFYKQKLIVNSINFRTGEESTTTIIPIKLIESDNEYDWTLDALDENEQKITYKVFKDFHSITNTEERFYENEI